MLLDDQFTNDSGEVAFYYACEDFTLGKVRKICQQENRHPRFKGFFASHYRGLGGCFEVIFRRKP